MYVLCNTPAAALASHPPPPPLAYLPAHACTRAHHTHTVTPACLAAGVATSEPRSNTSLAASWISAQLLPALPVGSPSGNLVSFDAHDCSVADELQGAFGAAGPLMAQLAAALQGPGSHSRGSRTAAEEEEGHYWCGGGGGGPLVGRLAAAAAEAALQGRGSASSSRSRRGAPSGSSGRVRQGAPVPPALIIPGVPPRIPLITHSRSSASASVGVRAPEGAHDEPRLGMHRAASMVSVCACECVCTRLQYCTCVLDMCVSGDCKHM